MWARLRAADSGTPRHPGRRRYGLSQTGHAVGRRQTAVLRRAGQDRQLSGRRVDRVDWSDVGVADQLRDCIFPRSGPPMPSAATRPGCRRRCAFARSGGSPWRHVREVRTAGFEIEAVVADADYGTTTAFRTGLERQGLRYAVAVRGLLHAWGRGDHLVQSRDDGTRPARHALGAACRGGRARRARWPRALPPVGSACATGAASAGSSSNGRWPTTRGSTTSSIWRQRPR